MCEQSCSKKPFTPFTAVMRKLFWEEKTVVAISVQKLEPVILLIAMITISEFIQSLTENLSISPAAIDERSIAE